jgi:mycofactocin precursor
MSDQTTTVTDESAPASAEPTTVLEQDLLVEDVSIDGMCGVY